MTMAGKPSSAGRRPRRAAALVALCLGAVLAPDAGAQAGRPAPSARAPAQIERRLERIRKQDEERRQHHAVRRRDQREALRHRLAMQLGARPITPAIRGELARHARRVAALRRIRLLAALGRDIDTVERADRILAREHARHAAWWRSLSAGAADGPEEPGKP
jgi:hypothetical protein